MEQSKYKTLAVAKQQFLIDWFVCNLNENDFAKAKQDLTELLKKAQEEKHVVPVGFFTFKWWNQ